VSDGIPRYAIAIGRFYEDLADRLIAGAQRAFVEATGEAADVYDVPGAFELPLVARDLANSGKYAAVAAAALVVDGGIYRHEFVAQAVISGLMQVQLETGTVVLSAVLTPHHFHHGSHEHTTFFHEHFVVKGTELAHACADTIAKVAKLHAAASGVADAEVLQAA